jgi:hypothetical protein
MSGSNCASFLEIAQPEKIERKAKEEGKRKRSIN